MADRRIPVGALIITVLAIGAGISASAQAFILAAVFGGLAVVALVGTLPPSLPGMDRPPMIGAPNPLSIKFQFYGNDNLIVGLGLGPLRAELLGLIKHPGQPDIRGDAIT